MSAVAQFIREEDYGLATLQPVNGVITTSEYLTMVVGLDDSSSKMLEVMIAKGWITVVTEERIHSIPPTGGWSSSKLSLYLEWDNGKPLQILSQPTVVSWGHINHTWSEIARLDEIEIIWRIE